MRPAGGPFRSRRIATPSAVWHAPPRGTTDARSAEEARAYLQERLALFGKSQREIEPARAAVTVALWSALTIAITTAASRTLYGLREELRDARQLGRYTLEEKLAGALGEAHESGLIHRDIKPANILLTRHGGEDDIAKVVDFGLVKDLGEETDPHLSDMGRIAGTPLYMAPEAMTSPEQVEARADLYALGAVGYYLLTGTHVFTGRTLSEIGAKHILETPEPLSRRAGRPIPAGLERLVLDCLAKRAEERPRSARALRERLLDCRDVEPWTEADARAWWEVHGPRLASRRSSVLQAADAGGAVRAVAVDLAARG